MSWLLFGLQALVLAVFIFLTLRLTLLGQVHPTSIAFYNPTHFNFSGVLQATGIVIVSYLGFDAISTLAEEATEPRRSVGRAIIGAIVGIGSLFVITTWLAGWVAPNYLSLNPATAFSQIINRVGGPVLTRLTDIVVVLSFGLAGGQEGQTAVSRILFAMGRDGILPRQFAYLHKTRRTPWVAIILVGALSLILSLTLTQNTVSNLVSFGALFGFLLLNLSVIYRFYLRGEKNLLTTLKYLLSPLIGFAVSLWIFLSLATSAKIVGGLWLLVGFLILLVKTRGFRQPIPRLEL
ncbi:APC family permease [[Lactobacillus] timonensis]|uniref:APC family permease n=1 Tax=[Lactobacillus] timonensis TaxID=1970790 RepID=UPI0038B5D638